MAASGAIARPTPSRWLLALAAVVALHAAAAVGVYLATMAGRPAERRFDPPLDPPPTAAPAPDPHPLAGQGDAGTAAPSAPDAAAAAAAPLELLSAPPIPRTAPVVPLPADRDDAADALEALRRRRVEAMLEQQRRRVGPP